MTEPRLQRLETDDESAGTREPPFRGPGWSRRWPKDRAFETNRRLAMRQLDKEVQAEKLLEHKKMEGLANGYTYVASKRDVVPDRYAMRARASLHGLAKDIDGLRVPIPATMAPVARTSHIQAPPCARPQSAASTVGTPRARPVRPPSAARAVVDAGGYVGQPESDGRHMLLPPKLPLHCLPPNQPRPGSARLPATPGRKPIRPSSAMASVQRSVQHPPTEAGAAAPPQQPLTLSGRPQLTPRADPRRFVAERERMSSRA